MHALASAATALAIVFHPATGPAKHWTLTCGPVGGTLPHRSAACDKLAKLRSPFAPTPPGLMCADIVYGTEAVDITGRFRGAAIKVHLTRRNSCEEARFMRVRFLFPVKLGLGG
jgi:Subtilisin inhibitor-like